MPTPQRRAPRAGYRLRAWLVRRSRLDATQRLASDEQLAAVQYGRQAATLLRQLFPDFYAEHVAQLPITPVFLLGAVQAFFSLAQQRIWLDHSYELSIDPSDPLRVLHPSLSGPEALGRLEEFHGWGLDEVCPEVYGIGGEQDELFDEGRNLLLAVLWYMADRTAWSAAAFDMEEVLDYWIDQLAILPEQATQLERLPQLDQGIAMDGLCDALNKEPCKLADSPVCDLGQVMRYAFSRTGNWFADLSVDELAEMGGSGIDWLADDLDGITAEQAEARQLWEQYHALNRFVTSDPTGIALVVDVVLAAARSLTAGVAVLPEGDDHVTAPLATAPAETHCATEHTR